MPATTTYPFRRIVVDHLVEGGSRVWWALFPTFRSGGPLSFQLQVGKTGLPNATDWIDVGSPVIDGYFAVDEEKRVYGKRLDTHYRVKLTDETGTVYVSLPAATEGALDERNWVLAREMIRKFDLLDPYVSTEGWLLKRRRYGPPCTRCLDTLTNAITDSKCPLCRGTGYLVGYHPPVPLCIQTRPHTIPEKRNGAMVPGQTQYTTVQGSVTAFPQLALEDVWVANGSDLRYSIDVIDIKTAIRGLPLLIDVTMHQLPFTDIVYRIPVGGEANDHALDELPTAGTGTVTVTHDYGGQDALAYTLPDGCGVEGATILAFNKVDYVAGMRAASAAVAATTTSANGRWTYALQLDPGDYILVAEKVGEYGPDVIELTVLAEDAGPASHVSSSFSSDFGLV